VKSVYRLQEPVTVLVEQTRGLKLQQLPAGSVLYANTAEPDHNSLIEVFCNGKPVQMFYRDLQDRALSIGAVYVGGRDQ